METVYKRPSIISRKGSNNFCPGCLHSATWKIIGEVLDEMNINNDTTWICGVGCCANAQPYVELDFTVAGHGRACAVASAYKRCKPEKLLFTYQGDGDLASIGLAETISAANRGENFTVVFVNNGIYGMTGGQMAPTTLVGAYTTTTPYGRNPKDQGYPLHMCELLNTLNGPSYIARVTASDAANVRKAKAAVKEAFQHQIDGKGFSFVEFVSNCPTNWGMTPVESLKYVHEEVIKEFPLGIFRNN